MHPAYSVIVFTTASGAGYGLLALLALLTVLGVEPQARWFMPVSLALALALVTTGLLSSTFHLGRPERAWRAFSQWRSSWLSREGVLAVVTFAPAGLLFLASVFGYGSAGILAALGVATIGLAAATVYSTAMIYASLTTIRTWHNAWVAPNYLMLALASGSVLLMCLWSLFGAAPDLLATGAIAALAVAGGFKIAYWRAVDGEEKTRTVEAATGLGEFGAVRPIDPPHTSANYIMKEMGYHVARRHAAKLRRIALLLAFALPALAILLAMNSAGPLAAALSVAAVASCAAGLVVERWLFFAQARHVVMLYYGDKVA